MVNGIVGWILSVVLALVFCFLVAGIIFAWMPDDFDDYDGWGI